MSVGDTESFEVDEAEAEAQVLRSVFRVLDRCKKYALAHEERVSDSGSGAGLDGRDGFGIRINLPCLNRSQYSQVVSGDPSKLVSCASQRLNQRGSPSPIADDTERKREVERAEDHSRTRT